MKRVRFALLALFVAVSTGACDGTELTGYEQCNLGNGPTMGSGC